MCQVKGDAFPYLQMGDLTMFFGWLLVQLHFKCIYCKKHHLFLREKQGKGDKPRTGATAEMAKRNRST